MRRPWFFVIIFLVLINTVVALPDVIIEPDEVELNVYKNIETSNVFVLHNVGNETAYNITFGNVSFVNFGTVTSLIPGQTTIVDTEILVNAVGYFTITTDMEFLYQFNESTGETTTHQINITNEGYQPGYVTIAQGDTVRFSNLDVINHTITSLDGLFDYTILPGSDIIVSNFIDENEYIFYDSINGNTGRVNVLIMEKEFYIHSSELDKTITLDLNSSLPNAEYQTIFYEDQFNVSHDSLKQSVFKIENSGEYPVINIDFLINNSYQDWFTFSKNNFTLQKDGSELITYLISPKINRTSQTNKTYVFDLEIIPENAERIEKEIKVFVPYEQLNNIELGNTTIVLNELSVDETIMFCLKKMDYPGCTKLKRFCLDYPDDPECKNFRKEKLVFVEKNVTFTGDQVQKMIDSIIGAENIYTRISNQYQPFLSIVKNATYVMKQSKDDIAKLESRQSREEQRVKDQEQTKKGWFIFWFIMKFIAVVLFIIFLLVRFIQHKKYYFERIRSLTK